MKASGMTLVARLRHAGQYLFWAGCVLLAASLGQARQPGDHAARFTIQGAIGPATTDYLERGFAEAEAAGAQVLLLQMDTPGGLDAATRDIVQLILQSPVPVITWVHPEGGRAASAGTYILYASHVAAMSPSTHLGAATPVSMTGEDVGGSAPDPASAPADNIDEAADETAAPADEKSRETGAADGSAMERKVINDAAAYIRGLAERHGRNAEWAERAVREAVTLTASEALEQNVVDQVAGSASALLTALDGVRVQMSQGTQVLATADLPLRSYAPDWRNEFLALITNPQVAYILLLIGLYGLVLEGYNPGALVPGVVGGISLLVGLYALQMLPLNWAGLGLMVLGVLLMAAEAFVPSFGVLGLGGLVALVLGSVFLLDSDVPAFALAWEMIAGVALVGVLVLGYLVYAIARSARMPRPAAGRALEGATGTVQLVRPDGGLQVMLHGERWLATAGVPMQAGDRVRVTEQQGLRLTVEPESARVATGVSQREEGS